MAMEDKIWVYTIGGTDDEFGRGVTGYTHDLNDALELFLLHCNHWDKWDTTAENHTTEFHIGRHQEEVGSYLSSNQYNVSPDEADALAKQHGFTLEDIGTTKENYGLY